jgi:hypothetical protein
VEETPRPPTLQEIKQKIDSYNSREKNCLGMKLVSGSAYPSTHSAPFRPGCLLSSAFQGYSLVALSPFSGPLEASGVLEC